MARLLCAFDLDNTLYDFISFFGPAYRGMLHALSKQTGLSYDVLNESARIVLHSRGTIEYPMLVREMSVFNEMSSAEILDLEKLAVSSHGRVRKKHLRVYEGVTEALESLSRSGVIIAAITNASTYKAVKRLEALGIVRHFSYVVGLDNIEISREVQTIGRSDPWAKYNSFLTPIMVDPEERKPSNVPFRKLLERVAVSVNPFSVGDNIGRDLAPASELGYTTIWARYGTRVDAHDYETVLYITPPAVKMHEVATSSYTPSYVIDSPLEAVSIISPGLF